MKREIITTGDGSVTIHLPEMKESYHSKFGAIQEAYHVFIKNGLHLKRDYKEINILEIGFGTGLNAFITYLETKKNQQQIYYTGAEAYPVSVEEAQELNYVTQLKAENFADTYLKMHTSPWETDIEFDNFLLKKRKQHFEEIIDVAVFDLIYFDAFGYHAQPELWSVGIFKKMYDALKPNGVLVTYACRTVIKNAMKEAGFLVEKLQGPPGKREMLRAVKI